MGMASKECAVASGKLTQKMQSFLPTPHTEVPRATMAHDSDGPHPGCLPDSLHGPTLVSAEASSRIRRPWSYTGLEWGLSDSVNFHLSQTEVRRK